MNLHHLKIFHAVAQHRSITAAATGLLLSQPAVSVQLKALERDLGLSLFERGGPKLRLTQAGEVLQRAAVSILSAVDEAERSISELRGGNKGRLILGAGTTGGMYVLPRVIQAYKAEWPETEILLQVGTTDQILDKLQQNVLDMGLVGGPIEDRRFTVEPLCGDELVLIAAPSHPITSLAKVTLRDLGGMPFIVPESGSRTRQLVERRLREAGVPLVIGMQLPGTEGVKRAVEAGLGIGMVSRYAVESEIQTGVLRRIPVEAWQLRRSMNLAYRAQKYFSPVGARFREFALAFGTGHLDPLDPQADRPARRQRAVAAEPAAAERGRRRGRAR